MSRNQISSSTVVTSSEAASSTDGVAMVLHCDHQLREDRGNECSKEVIPAKAIKLSAKKMNAY